MRGVTYQKKSKQESEWRCFEIRLEVRKLKLSFWRKYGFSLSLSKIVEEDDVLNGFLMTEVNL